VCRNEQASEAQAVKNDPDSSTKKNIKKVADARKHEQKVGYRIAYYACITPSALHRVLVPFLQSYLPE
jgi:hypothetical protein